MFPGVGMKQLIPKLATQLEHFCNVAHKITVAKYVNILPQGGNDAITNDWLWPRFGEFFKENDVILAETGSPQYGIIDIPLPKGSVLLSQMRWASIGWTVGELCWIPEKDDLLIFHSRSNARCMPGCYRVYTKTQYSYCGWWKPVRINLDNLCARKLTRKIKRIDRWQCRNYHPSFARASSPSFSCSTTAATPLNACCMQKANKGK